MRNQFKFFKSLLFKLIANVQPAVLYRQFVFRKNKLAVSKTDFIVAAIVKVEYMSLHPFECRKFVVLRPSKWFFGYILLNRFGFRIFFDYCEFKSGYAKTFDNDFCFFVTTCLVENNRYILTIGDTLFCIRFFPNPFCILREFSHKCINPFEYYGISKTYDVRLSGFLLRYCLRSALFFGSSMSFHQHQHYRKNDSGDDRRNQKNP